MAKTINVNGKVIKLSRLRTSKKGAAVDGARVHVEGLGTVYVQVYEPRQAVREHVQRITQRQRPQRQVREADALMVEILQRLSERMDAIEDKLTEPYNEPRPTRPSAPRPNHSPPHN
jgi:hypothetical protein